MRLILAVLFISTLQIQLKCDDENSKQLADSKPVEKKLSKTITVNNARKFEPIKRFYANQILPKKNNELKLYTVFPPYPAAPVGKSTERKTRIKKVLPSYGYPLARVKRSTGSNSNDKKANKVRKGKRLVGKTKKKIARNGSNSKAKPKKQAKKPKKYIKRTAQRKPTPKDKKVVFRSVVGKKKPKLRNAKKNKTPSVPKTKKKVENNKSLKTRFNKALRNKKKAKKRKNPLRKSQEKKIVKRKVRTRRLIAARGARIEDYPYVVSIQKNGEHWCSGALLNQRLVITTANCVWKAHRMSRLQIRAGSRYLDRGGQTARIQEVAKHPLWNIRSPPDNDISLLLLDRFLKFSASVHSVDLPNKAMMPAFDDAWVTSWGADRRDGVYDSSPKILQVYHTELLNRKQCNNVTMRFGVFVTDNFICLAQTGRRAPCTRDTGAPAVSDGIVWGLASWGIRKLCGTQRFPAVFSYVASLTNMDFITNATLRLMSDERYDPYPDRF